MGEFTREVTDVIVRNWLLRRPGMEDYLYEGHTWGYPSLVVTTPDGTPVAWVAQHFFGVPSFMFVKEDYRGKGIASAILSKITKAIIDRDGYAFSFLIVGNPAPIVVHEKVGYTKIPNATDTLCTLE